MFHERTNHGNGVRQLKKKGKNGKRKKKEKETGRARNTTDNILLIKKDTGNKQAPREPKQSMSVFSWEAKLDVYGYDMLTIRFLFFLPVVRLFFFFGPTKYGQAACTLRMWILVRIPPYPVLFFYLPQGRTRYYYYSLILSSFSRQVWKQNVTVMNLDKALGGECVEEPSVYVSLSKTSRLFVSDYVPRYCTCSTALSPTAPDAQSPHPLGSEITRKCNGKPNQAL